MKIKLDYIFVLIILLAVSQYFIVSLNSPIVFGDEGYYASTSRWIAENHIIPEFRPLAENAAIKDRADIIPMFFMTETFFFYFGEIGPKLMFPLLALIAALTTYTLVKSLSNKKTAFFAALTLIFTPAFITYGVMGYVDILLFILITSTMIFTLKAFKTEKKTDMILAGIFSAFCVLTKISGPTIFFFIILYTLSLFRGKADLSNWNKNYIKTFLIICLIAFLFIAPLLIRNISLFGDVCYRNFAINKENCGYVYLQNVENIDSLEYASRNTGTSTEAGLINFGILNYFNFAHGLIITILLIIGLGLSISELKNKNILKISIISLLASIPIIIFSLERAEDTARYMLPMNIGIVMIIGFLLNAIYENSKKINKYLAITIIVIILFYMWGPISDPSWGSGQQKIDTMKSVKQFSPGFIDACNWVKENTPQNAVLLSTYEYHTRYQCNRNSIIGESKGEVFLSFNDTSYDYMKLNGITHIFVIKSLISEGKFSENYPIEFINYIENSNKFKQIFDNEQSFGPNSIIIYEVL
jgi:4-amino-4-deoxy-L-arabinose transferase-like glycosyltransferase